jgi:hypothetical protein
MEKIGRDQNKIYFSGRPAYSGIHGCFIIYFADVEMQN